MTRNRSKCNRVQSESTTELIKRKGIRKGENSEKKYYYDYIKKISCKN